MHVVVTNVWTDQSKLFEGMADTILQQIFFQYPFLRSEDDSNADLHEILEHLDATGAYQVDVENDSFAKSADATSDSIRNVVRFLKTSKAYGILGPAGTWNAGGCYLLAHAMNRHLGGHLVGVASSKSPLEHVALHLGGDKYVDADGLQSRQKLLENMSIREGLPAPHLVPFTRAHHEIARRDFVFSTNQEKELHEALAPVIGHTLKKSNLSPDDLRADSKHPVILAMLGFQPTSTPEFQAARWMSGGRDLPIEAVRRALYDEDGNVESAALKAYGFEVNETNLKALNAVRGMGDFSSPSGALVKHIANVDVVAAHSEGEDVAQAIRRAFDDQFVLPVALAGKHSKGSLIARDQKSNKTYLLKPGSGKAGAAAGAEQDPSTQSAREAAWYHIVKEWGLWSSYPRAELIIIDGEQYAALELLPWSYKTAEKWRASDPGMVRRVLTPYLMDGRLHQWAIVSFVLGNGDDHGENLMFNAEGDVKLIDHGSAFAGPAFDPAHDKNSFIPYALRSWAPHSVNFNALTPEEKLRYMPRAPASVSSRVGQWVLGLSAGALEALCARYGINPQPTLDRLARVKEAVVQLPADEAIERLWVTT